MFWWAIIDEQYNVLSIRKAAIDVPASRKFEHWALVPDNTKLESGLKYNINTRSLE